MSKWRCVVISTCKFRFLKFSMFEYVGYNSAVELVLVMALLRTRSELLTACLGSCLIREWSSPLLGSA